MATRPAPEDKPRFVPNSHVATLCLGDPEDRAEYEKILTLSARGLVHILERQGPELNKDTGQYHVCVHYQSFRQMTVQEIVKAKALQVAELNRRLGAGTYTGEKDTEVRTTDAQDLTEEEKELLESTVKYNDDDDHLPEDVNKPIGKARTKIL